MSYLYYVFVSIVAYLLGNFSTSYIVTKRTAHIDIREHGSGNAGSTNVLRVLGLKPAAVTFIGDSVKGAAAVLIGRYILGRYSMDAANYGAALAGVFVVLGHNWPIALKFKGGKGIASTIGVVLAINPLIGLACVLTGGIMLFAFKYVSLGSLTGVAVLPIIMLVLKQPKEYLILGIALALLAIYRHKGNIERLIKGTEAKLGQRSNLN